jgi:hypothetical protein
MKKLIMTVLAEECCDKQINMDSEAARESIALAILNKMRNRSGGWFLDLGSYPPKKSSKS